MDAMEGEADSYKHAHLNRPRAVEDIRSHDGTVFSKGVGTQTGIAMLLGTGRKLRPVRSTGLRINSLRRFGRQLRPQGIGLFRGELKRKIFGETLSVTLELFVQAFGRNTINRRQIAIQNDPFIVDFANQIFNSLNGGR
jgi:hypothetical protein